MAGISKEIKDEVLGKVKSGVTVAQISKQYGVSQQSIYKWLRGTITEPVSVREMQKLRKENRELKEIIGALTIEKEKIKKKMCS